MATLDDSPSLYLGQPWSVWANKVEGKKKDGTTERDVVQPQKKDSNAMKLRKRDMSLYGHCPARDEFFLVVCESCGQVIKPQALQRHIEQRHGTKVSVCRVLTSGTQSKVVSTSTSALLPNLTQSSHSSTKHDLHGKTPPDTKGGTRTATPPPPSNSHHGKMCSSQLSSPSKRNHSVVPVVKVERMMPSLVNSSSTSKKSSGGSSSNSKSSPSSKSSSKSSPYSKLSKSSSSKSSSCKSSNSSSKSSSSSTRVSESPPVPKSPLTKTSSLTSVEFPPPLSPVHKVPPTAMGSSQSRPASSPAHSTAAPTAASTTSTTSATPSTNGPSKPASSSKAKANKPNPNKIIPCKDREYDVNIHCGAWVDGTGRQCTRSLTCKTHTLSIRRAVEGRRKPFDELLAEHRAAKEALLKAKAEALGKTYIPPGSKSPGSSHASSSATVAQLTSGTKADHKSPGTSSVALTQHCKLPKPALPLPPRPVPVPVVPKEEPVPETCSRLSSDGEEDGDEEKDRLGYPHLPYHPRPAAVNNFGSRLAGNGCYVFNRRTDLLRAAFMVAVEHHLHPPPHKKLCVESKLPHGSQITTNTKDPYEFPESGQNAQFGAWGSGTRLASKAKVKPPPPAGRTIKPKDMSGSRSPSGSGHPSGGMPLVGTTVNIAHPIGNISTSGPLKRKRSGSGSANAVTSLGNQSMHLGGVGTTTLTSLPAGIAVSESNGSPISISLPPGNLTLSAINAAVSLAGKNPLNTLTTAGNHMLKDVNIVVTSMDPTNVVNGQIIGSQLTNYAQLRLNQLIDKPAAGNQQRSRGQGIHNQGSKHVNLKAANVPEGASAGLSHGSLVHALSGNTVMMDQSRVLTSIGMSPPELSPSQNTNRSSSSPLSQTSPLPNGLLPSSGQILKGVPLNHVAAAGAMAVSPASNCSTPSPAPLDAAAPQHIQAHAKTQSGRHKKSSLSSHGNLSQLAPGGAITLAGAHGRLQPQTMLYNPVQLSGGQVPFSHIQIQPRAGSGKAAGKISMQPVSLTIPVVASQGVQLNTQQQQRALLLPGDERRTHDLSQQMSNSPSNMIS